VEEVKDKVSYGVVLICPMLKCAVLYLSITFSSFCNIDQVDGGQGKHSYIFLSAIMLF
jgi:hypothetical protein